MEWQNRLALGKQRRRNRPESGDRRGLSWPTDVTTHQRERAILLCLGRETIYSGATFRALLRLALPRAKALGYYVLPFHGRCARRIGVHTSPPFLAPRCSRLAPLGEQALAPAAGSAVALVSRYGLGDRSENKRTPWRISPSAFSADCPREQS
jgi:hypothetical protein